MELITCVFSWELTWVYGKRENVLVCATATQLPCSSDSTLHPRQAGQVNDRVAAMLNELTL